MNEYEQNVRKGLCYKHADTSKDEDGKAVVLVTENTVGAEMVGSVHVVLALIGSAAHAVHTIGVVQAVVMGIDGHVFKRNDLITVGGLLSLPPSLQGQVLGIALHDINRVLSGPDELDELVRTSPEFVGAEALGISEADLTVVSYVPSDNRLGLLYTRTKQRKIARVKKKRPH